MGDWSVIEWTTYGVFFAPSSTALHVRVLVHTSDSLGPPVHKLAEFIGPAPLLASPCTTKNASASPHAYRSPSQHPVTHTVTVAVEKLKGEGVWSRKSWMWWKAASLTTTDRTENTSCLYCIVYPFLFFVLFQFGTLCLQELAEVLIHGNDFETTL